MTKPIKKYLRDGQAVIFLQELGPRRILVSQLIIVQGYDGETEYEEEAQIMIVPEVFDKPPTIVIDKEIQAMHQELKDANVRLNTINQKIRDLSIDYNEIIAKIGKRHSALKHIEEFIDDKIQFFFMANVYSPGIITKNEGLKSDDRWDNKWKLLSLYGNSAGDLEWRINTYSDGSGGYTTVIPCITLEDAKLAAQNFINSLDPTASTSSRIILMAKTYGLDLPEGYEEKNAADTIAQKQQYVDRAKSDLLKVQKDLEETKAGITHDKESRLPKLP